MNNQRRSQINALIERVCEISADVEILEEEEQGCLDNMPESLQESERGDLMFSAIDAFQEARAALDETVLALEEAGR